jgi:hypothetical protein
MPADTTKEETILSNAFFVKYKKTEGDLFFIEGVKIRKLETQLLVLKLIEFLKFEVNVVFLKFLLLTGF